jgi:hypothetical protein
MVMMDNMLFSMSVAYKLYMHAGGTDVSEINFMQNCSNVYSVLTRY